NRHLSAGVWIIRTVIAVAAAGGDSLGREPLDPVGEGELVGVGTRDIAEDAGAGWRRISDAVLGLQEKRGHLGSADDAVGAILKSRNRVAAAGDVLVVELLDPVGEADSGRAGNVREGSGWRTRRRDEGCSVLALQEEDRHLRSGHAIV